MLYEGAAGTVGAIAAEDARLAVSGNVVLLKSALVVLAALLSELKSLMVMLDRLSLLPANVNDMTLSLSQYLSALIISASVWLKVSASKEILILELPVLIRCKR